MMIYVTVIHYEQYMVWHLLSEMNPKKLHANPGMQEKQSKSETPPL